MRTQKLILFLKRPRWGPKRRVGTFFKLLPTTWTDSAVEGLGSSSGELRSRTAGANGMPCYVRLGHCDAPIGVPCLALLFACFPILPSPLGTKEEEGGRRERDEKELENRPFKFK